MNRLRAWLCLFGALCLLPSAAAAQEAAPLLLDGTRSLSFGEQNYFDLGREGTLEVWVAALWEEDPGYAPTVLASRGVAESEEDLASSIRYSVHISGDRMSVGMTDGLSYEMLPFDFTDGAYHHVGLITRGARTEIVVDGSSIGEIALGYGSSTGLPFHVGAADGESDFFIGAIWAMRIWDRAITKVGLAALSENAGPPDPSNAYAPNLVAYSAFTTEAEDILLGPVLGEEEEVDDGSDVMAEAEVAMPESTETDGDPTGVWVVRDSMVFERKQLPGESDTKQFVYKSYPIWRVDEAEAVETQLSTRQVGASSGRPFRDNSPAGSQIVEVKVVAEEARINSVRVSVRTPQGRRVQLAVHGTGKKGKTHTFKLEEGEGVIGISGSFEKELTSLRIHTNRRASPRFGTELGETFAQRLPDGVFAAGFEGRAGRTLNAIALAYTGTATGVRVTGSDGASRKFTPAGGGTFVHKKSKLVMDGEDQFVLDDDIFERVEPYTVDEEKESYNDLFAVSNQLYNVEYSFRSYDIGYLDPWDFKQSGAKRSFMKFPGEGSTSWSVQNRSMIPHGVRYVTVNQGGSDVRTDTHSSESSYQEALSRNISFGGVASLPAFTWNETYKQTMNEMYNQEKQYTYGEAMIAVYSLVFEPARASLDDTFIERVRELSRTGNYKDFIQAYGTHYPHSVTYGGKGIQQMEMDSSTYEKLLGDNVDIQMSVMGTILSQLTSGKAAGFNDFFSGSSDVNDSFKQSMSTQKNTFRWIGGAGGFSTEGWNVMENLSPVYLDLKPLDELLTAPFFVEEEITQKTRKGLKRAIAKYLGSAPKPRTKDIRPQVYEVVVTGIENVKSSEIDRKAELAGSIEIIGKAGRGKKLTSPSGDGTVWKRSASNPTVVRDGVVHNPKTGRQPGESPRYVFAVSEEDVKAGAYAQITGNLRETDADGERVVEGQDGQSLGRQSSPKLLFRNAKKGPPTEGVIRFREKKCSGSCAEARVKYRWGRLE